MAHSAKEQYGWNQDMQVALHAKLREDLKGIENIIEAHSVYGVYDVVVKIEADTMEKLKETIHREIRGLDNVRSTLTMIVMVGKK